MRRTSKASTGGTIQGNATRIGTYWVGILSFSLAALLGLPFASMCVGTAFAAAPTVPATTVSAVTAKTAVLEVDINPQGEATSYHFEYGLADCASNACTSVPVPDANVGSGSAVLRVTREVVGLQPATTYHLRVVATNTSGLTEGPDRTFTTYALQTHSSNCPNQAVRVGPSALLPDCRAYEMVSPVDKNGGAIENATNLSNTKAAFFQSSLNGEKIAYSAEASFADQPSNVFSNQYIASRGTNGWITRGINAPRGPNLFEPFLLSPELNTYVFAFSPDLSSSWLWDFNTIPLTPDGTAGYTNLYRRDNVADTYEALTIAQPLPEGEEPPNPFLDANYYRTYHIEGFSADASMSFYSAAKAFTPNADMTGPEVKQLYVLSDGELDLVSVLPDGTPSPHANVLGNSGGNQEDAGNGGDLKYTVSEDGSRVFWRETGLGTGSQGRLYVRENPTAVQSALSGGECTEPAKACTIDVGASVAATGNVRFETATPDGSTLWFSLPSGGGTLYKYAVDTETPTLIAEEFKGVIGASEDGSRLYFASREPLAPGATPGEVNIYLREGGAETFVATVSELDNTLSNFAYALTSENKPRFRTSRVSPDGRFLAFMSNRSLTGYDNTDAVSGEPNAEVFHYDANTGELSCASCNPSGARPIGARLRRQFSGFFAGTLTNAWGAAWLPGSEHEQHSSRSLSEDGALFFNSYDALLPEDTNGSQDVYQWVPQGVRDCQREGGCVALISTGQSPDRSEFVDASASGDNVFFTTASNIVPQDVGARDLYAARVGGGLPQPPSLPECIGDACQDIPPRPDVVTPASAAFTGAGDPTPRRDCSAVGRRAVRLSRRAKRLQRAARRSLSATRAQRLRRRSARLTRLAERAGRSAKRCRRASQGAGR